MMTPIDLRTLSWQPVNGFWYLATPYSKYAGGIENAFKDACKVSGQLIAAGVPIFCPIAHTHPMAVHADLDPLDHSFWLPADKPLMDAAHGLVVALMDGWESSYGIRVEIGAFEGRPIHYLSMEGILE